MVKSLPAVQKTWGRSLGQEDPLEKEMTTPSSISALVKTVLFHVFGDSKMLVA